MPHLTLVELQQALLLTNEEMFSRLILILLHQPEPQRRDSSRIVALDASGHRHSVHWVATDLETGLTLLRLTPRTVRPIRPANGVPNLGSQAFVVGNPFGTGTL